MLSFCPAVPQMKTKILVIEDDPGIRRSLVLTLEGQGYAVAEASNGRIGLDMAAAEAPALIICDVNMPEMDGYEVVAAIRRTSALASIPFVFLTARGEPAEMRRGMNLGADDYLTKPFTREELTETVKVRLQKHEESREALTGQLILAGERMRSRFYSRLTGAAEQPPIDDALQPAERNAVTEATVLFTDIRGFTTISERLSVVEIATLLNHYFRRACEPIVAANGKVVKFIGDGIMAVFSHGEDAPRERQALHAIQAGLALSLVAHEFRGWMQAQFPGRGLPEFAIGVGIHTGEVTLCDVGAAGERNFTAIGDTVNIASRLEGQTKELGWPVVASSTAISAAGDEVIRGAHRVVNLRGRTKPVLVYQILGLKGLGAPALTGDGLGDQLRRALAGNAEGAAVAAKAALRETLLALLSQTEEPTLSAPMRIKSYAVVARLEQADHSALYLAERESDGKRVAMRIRRRRDERDDAFQRFVECAPILGSIDHPHAAPILDHGFADDVTYVVTEHFPRGNLKQAFPSTLPSRQVLGILRQALGGLVAVHEACKLAKGLEPENLMVRDNGDIALAGLDCISSGQRGDERSDLYSLGLIVRQLLGDGANAGSFQPVLNRMLAEDPAQRYPDARAALQALEALA
jgi:class 3 adenylate cyclase